MLVTATAGERALSGGPNGNLGQLRMHELPGLRCHAWAARRSSASATPTPARTRPHPHQVLRCGRHGASRRHDSPHAPRRGRQAPHDLRPTAASTGILTICRCIRVGAEGTQLAGTPRRAEGHRRPRPVCSAECGSSRACPGCDSTPNSWPARTPAVARSRTASTCAPSPLRTRCAGRPRQPAHRRPRAAHARGAPAPADPGVPVGPGYRVVRRSDDARRARATHPFVTD